MAKLTAAVYKAQEAKFRQLRLAAEREEQQARLVHLGTLVAQAGFTVDDTADLAQALAWYKTLRNDPERWEVIKGGLVEVSVNGEKNARA